jgi:hypothetical protein
MFGTEETRGSLRRSMKRSMSPSWKERYVCEDSKDVVEVLVP